MSPALRVLAPGLLTTVQDLGRPGYQALGISVSGALDPVSLQAANLLVGNPPGAGALEVAYVGPSFVVEAEEARLSFVGASAAIEILPAGELDSVTRIAAGRSICLPRGTVVRIGSLTGGAVLYVAVEGGFDIEPVFDSVSTFLRGGFGGWEGRALREGDRLPLARARASGRGEWQFAGLDLTPPERFRIIPGPQSDHFTPQALAALAEGEYRVCVGSDRTAMRLEGPRLDHRCGFNIVSDGIAPGSIQVPGNGQPMVLLADRQTTGGYPKIATVISADLPALGRLAAGAPVRFTPVTLETAEVARRALFADIAALADKMVPVEPCERDITARLFDCNLIGGVIDAHRDTHAGAPTAP